MNGLFGRGQQPQPPQSPQYNRLPDQGYAQRPSSQRLPPPSLNDYGVYEKRSQGQPNRSTRSAYTVTAAPNETLALTNCIIVHPSDFDSGQHVLIKQEFPLTTRQDDSGKIKPGHIGASGTHRQWIGLSLVGEEVTVEPISSHPPYLESIDIEVGFMRRGHEIAEVFSADEMVRNFIRAYNGIMFAAGEILVFEFHGQTLKGTVKGVGIVDLPTEQHRRAAPHSFQDAGVLMEKTDVNFLKAGDSAIKIKSSGKKAATNAILPSSFKFEDMGIGGLDSEFSAIFRRAFASRVFPPSLVEKLGIQHVKGILLHGPPGTGKTLMARQIGKMLNAREPKIVNGPEILNKYVGASEENIRKLFADAEKEYKEKGDESGLHIIIFDELDAICKQRGSTGGGTGVGDSVVNQLLSKMDGVDQLNNILIIGMTNRLDMIDEALLRPGRLEVHMEISLPDENGRYQILTIHTAKMRKNGVMDSDVNLAELASWTKNFSGAEIGGLVKSATSFAFTRHVKIGTVAGIGEDVEDLRVNRTDFISAFDEVKPAFGVSEEELDQVIQNGIIPYDPSIQKLLDTGKLFVDQVRTSERTPLVSVLLHGSAGTGKTALAAKIAQASKYPFIKLVSSEAMVGFNDAQKVAAINKVFADSYKSPESVIVVDNLERLLDFVAIGPRFSNSVLQALLVLLARRPPKGRRLLIIATSSVRPALTDLGFSEVFDADLHIAPISNLRSLEYVLDDMQLFSTREHTERAMGMLQQAGFGGDDEMSPKFNIGIKKLLSIIEMSRQLQQPQLVAERLTNSLMPFRV